MDKSRFENVRRLSILIIIGPLFTGVILIVLLSHLAIGFPWSILVERLWLLSSIVLALVLIGYIYLYFRLSVLKDLAFALSVDQPLSEDLVRPAARMMYSLPAAMGITCPLLLVLGTLVHAVDLIVNFGYPLRALLFLLTSSFMILCFVAITIYFFLKREFRPLFTELTRRASPEILARLDRTWQIPGGREVEFNIPVRVKVIFGILTVALAGFWFCFFSYNLGMNFIEEHNAEIGAALSNPDNMPSIQKKWIALLAVQFVFGLGLAVLLGWYISKDILFPFRGLKDREPGEGEAEAGLYSALSEDEIGEFVQLWDSRIKDIHAEARGKLQGLVATIGRLHASLTGINTAADRIVELAQKQSEDATTQVAMISEVSASSVELSNTAAAIAGHAGRINEVTEMAQGEGDSGIDFVSSMIQQMDSLRANTGAIKNDLEKFQKYTREVHGVLEIIEEISDQINLLSLNAELEAAGSGEAGRRFAVVASEIKRLASGTLGASEQIRRIISDILESSQTISRQSGFGAEMIETSSAMANDVSNAFIQIFQYIQDITVLVKDIASSTGQQQRATDMITDNLREMLDSGTSFERECAGIQNEIEELRIITKELQTFMEQQK